MLQIQQISKEYKTGSLIQKALNQVSMNLRDNEFVAILGPSGSGKTTLLNIIGGLDRYDSGNLIINGISTERYTDRDWDSYRNHTIGFVFQSYNLIPHQTVLSNVELALTISGISRNERKKRAIHALNKVGLSDHIHKKPNQLSGGQMQRVAIARALVNDPKVLLADEPTGALDTETSVQVMDLLKEVAKDRLVVMVTHNPELADEYATRIITLRDGQIRSDSDPYEVDDSGSGVVHRNLGKSSMSFLTALSLSFNNLRTKLTRTILVSFAGSIGIIGIALILSLSNGVNSYIHSIEESTLSEYPLQITSTSFDFSTMVVVQNENDDNEPVPDENPSDAEVREIPMLNGMLSRTTSNDLVSLKRFLEEDSSIQENTNAIEYSFNLEPYIYYVTESECRQVNPDISFAALGIGGGGNNSLLSLFSSTNQFFALPEKEELYKPQYEVVAGRWPSSSSEAVLVLFRSGNISDLQLYTLGLRDSKQLDQLIQAFANEENVQAEIGHNEYAFSDFLGINFKVLSPWRFFSYDSEYDVWVDKSSDKDFIDPKIRSARDLTIVGVVKAKADSDVAMLQTGIYYPFSLIRELVEESALSNVTSFQIQNRTKNIFTGIDFASNETQSVDLGTLFTFDQDALENAFYIDTNALRFDSSVFSGINVDLNSLVDPTDLVIDTESLSSVDLSSMLSEIKIKVNQDEVEPALSALVSDYLTFAGTNPETDYSRMEEAIKEYLNSPDTRLLLQSQILEIIAESGGNEISADVISDALSAFFSEYLIYAAQHGYLDPESLQNGLSEFLSSEGGQEALQALIGTVSGEFGKIEISEESVESLLSTLAEGYEAYAAENYLPDPALLSESLNEYFESERGKQNLKDTAAKIIDTDDLQKQAQKWFEKHRPDFSSGISSALQPVINKLVASLTGQISSAMSSAVSDLGRSMANAIHFDPSAFTDAFSLTMTETDLQALMMSMMSSDNDSYEGNLRKLGYADLDRPFMISIYPKDFNAKEEIVKTLDRYNEKMKEEEPEKVITYSDTVGVLMSSVTTIIDTISYVLVAFVAISLVVSSIMIGVITYISVLERQKEIGILRSIGASKRNISEVFNAETFIIGLLAGVLGIVLTRLILIPGNILIHHLTDNPNVNAFLPVRSALILIALSVILTIIGGLLPSRKAAKSDPVAALRTE